MKVGDKVILTQRSVTGRLEEIYEATAKKVTPTGQVTVDAGVWPGNGTPRIVRFKIAAWGGGYTEIGGSTYHRWRLHFGETLDAQRKDLMREKAKNEGAGRIRELKRKLETTHPESLDDMKKATAELLKAVDAAIYLRDNPMMTEIADATN